MADLDDDVIRALAERVTAFLDGLPDDERELLEAALGLVADASANDVEGFGSLHRSSNAMQAAIDAQEQAINRQGMAGGGGSSRRKASMDNIQKFLDILHSMNPQI